MLNRLIYQICWNVQTETLQQNGMVARIKEAGVFVAPKIPSHVMAVHLMGKVLVVSQVATTRAETKNASMMVGHEKSYDNNQSKFRKIF